MSERKDKNPRVFLDFQIGKQFVGQVVIELFTNLVPKTAENFRGLCTGEYGLGLETNQPLCYAGCKVIKIIPGQYIRCGDFSKNDGSGGESIYGGKFNDENFNLWHANAGVVSMYNDARNSNGSQFLITLKKAAQLNRRHVVFGQVRSGMHILRAIERLPIDMQDRPRVPIFVVGCGQTTRGRTLGNELASAAERGKKLLRTLALQQDPLASDEVTQKPKNTKYDHLPEAVAAFLRAGDIDGSSTAREHPLEGEHLEGEHTVHSECNDSDSNYEDEEVCDDSSVERRSDPPNIEGNTLALDTNSEVKLTKWQVLKNRIDRENEKNESLVVDDGESDSDSNGERPKRKWWSNDAKWYLNDTLAQVKAKDAIEAQKQRSISFGWNVWNQRSVYQSYEKQLARIHVGAVAKSDQNKPIEGEHIPDEEGRKRLAMLFTEKKKQKRHRPDMEIGDVNYVNRQNRKFNKKLEKAYGAYTLEIKQNLERGTAL